MMSKRVPRTMEQDGDLPPESAGDEPLEPGGGDFEAPTWDAADALASESSSAGRLLIVSPDAAERARYCRILEKNDFHVRSAAHPGQVFGKLERHVDLVISRWGRHTSSGMRFLQQWKARHPQCAFLVVSPSDEPELAVQAMKCGADDYLMAPVAPERLLEEVRECLAIEPARRTHIPGCYGMVGRSPAMQRVWEKVHQAAQANSTVLITGESGTGKELIARAIHRASPRATGPWVAFNMAAVPEALVESELFGHVRGAYTGAEAPRVGRFEAADGGTIFIDEIGDVSWRVQAKLLRVLEDRCVGPVGSNEQRAVDIRIVAASRRRLEALVERHLFRSDLYFRLNIVRVELPPLRDRQEDIPLLVDFFLQKFSEQYGTPPLEISPGLMRCLQQGSWPGNVRQLRNVIESMVVLSHGVRLTEADLPQWFHEDNWQWRTPPQIPPGMKLAELQQAAVLQVLERCDWNTAKAAAALGVSLRTLQRKVKKWRGTSGRTRTGRGRGRRASASDTL